MGNMRRVKRAAKSVFSRSSTNELKDDKSVAQIIVAATLILNEMPDGERKNEFKKELLLALDKAYPDANNIIEGYEKETDAKFAIKLYNDITDIANGRWQDPGIINKYFISALLASGQALGYGIAVFDHLSKRDHRILAGFLGPAAVLANFYFSYDSLPSINSNIKEDLGQFLSNRRNVSAAQISKLLAKHIFSIFCAACSAMVETSFVVDSRESFGNQDVLYYGAVALVCVAMALIYKNSLDDLINKIPEPNKWQSEARDGLLKFKTTTFNEPHLLAIYAFTTSVALSRVGAFSYSTYKNYQAGFGATGAVTVAALSAIPSTCLVVSSTMGAQNFFAKRFFGSRGYIRQQDVESDDLGQQSSRILLADMLLATIAATVFLSGAASTASLIDSGYWFVFSAFCVSAAIFARGYLAKIKTPEEINNQQNFIKSITSTSTDVTKEMVQKFRQDNKVSNDTPGVNLAAVATTAITTKSSGTRI